jgi:hypothetical protein
MMDAGLAPFIAGGGGFGSGVVGCVLATMGIYG